MKRNWIATLQIAATYVGTVVGAGFASGQSIMQFFSIYGAFGGVGILASTVLFIWTGIKMMILSHRIKAYSYQELNRYLFGDFLGKAANITIFVMLFGLTAVMLSGTGSVFEEQLGLPYQLGIVFTIALSYLVMSKELQGILAANSLVVPMMFFFLVLVFVYAVGMDGLLQAADWESHPWRNMKWVLSPFAYTALNFAFIQAVMVPMASTAENESVLKWGGFWGGVMLGVMLLISHVAIHSRMPGILQFDIPMAEIIRSFGGVLHVLFVLAIYGEIFTSVVGNVFGMTRHLIGKRGLPKGWLVMITLLACFLISQIGFAPLVAYLYPLFGYMGLILLVFLIAKPLPGK
jgi:uncharacterized membrane protein YkvI